MIAHNRQSTDISDQAVSHLISEVQSSNKNVHADWVLCSIDVSSDDSVADPDFEPSSSLSVEDSEVKSGSASPVVPESECGTMTVAVDHSVNDNNDMELV